MNAVQTFIERFPIASAVFVLYSLAGGLALVLGDLTNGEYVDSLLKVGAGTGAIGAARSILNHR